ncbi:hypothetical protein [Rhodopirellula halodulae]|uniref:hypothetical protein n=1 Tax=Rhodopirellula halodulae TaxID=2894198 RepID=UPI001E58540C|nr:hypothetical protein [Rhodopirellula sp. JC737]MCC9655302.1 hypothetical protein [Rhodopirellula sp. JC737]
MSSLNNVSPPSGAQPGLGGAYIRMPDSNGSQGDSLRVASVANGGHALEWFTTYDTATIDSLIQDIELTPGPQGEQGPQGEPGYGFEIEQIFNSVAELQAGSVTAGRFGLVAGTLSEDDEDYGKLYLYDGTSWTYVTDMSVKGAAGVQGPAGADGAQGPAGPNEVSASTETDLTGLLVGDGSNVSSTLDPTLASIKGNSSNGLQMKYADNNISAYFAIDLDPYGANVFTQPRTSRPSVTILPAVNGTVPALSVRSPDSVEVLTAGDLRKTVRLYSHEPRTDTDDPTDSEIPEDAVTLWANSTSGEVGWWINDGGTVRRLVDTTITSSTETDLDGVLVGDGSNVSATNSLDLSGLEVNTLTSGSTLGGMELKRADDVLYGYLGALNGSLGLLTILTTEVDQPALMLLGKAGITDPTLFVSDDSGSEAFTVQGQDRTTWIYSQEPRTDTDDPTDTDIPEDTITLWANSTSGEVNWWINDDGTVRRLVDRDSLGLDTDDTVQHAKMQLDASYDAIALGDGFDGGSYVGTNWDNTGFMVFATGAEGIRLYHNGAGSCVFWGQEYQSVGGGIRLMAEMPNINCTGSTSARNVGFSSPSWNKLSKFSENKWFSYNDPSYTIQSMKTGDWLWGTEDWVAGFCQEYDNVAEEIKHALYGVTPVARATTGITAATFAANTSGISDDTATFDGYTIGQIVAALKAIGILT